VDEGGIDGANDASSDAVATPDAAGMAAKWAIRYEHARFGLLSQGGSSAVYLSAQVSTSADFGKGPCNCGVASVRFDLLTGKPDAAFDAIPAVSLFDVSPGAEVAVGKPYGVILGIPVLGSTFPGNSHLRIRLGGREAVVVDNPEALTNISSADSIPSVQVDKGDVAIFDVTGGGPTAFRSHVIYGNLTPTVAIDAVLRVTDGITSFVYMAGRSNGAFNFEGKNIAGPGLFLVKYNLDTFVPEWAKLYGGTPLQDISAGVNDVVGVGARLSWDAAKKEVVLTLPFKGTVDLGTGPLNAPANSHAVAFARIDPTTGSAKAAAAYGKGPLSDGKPTRARVVLAAGHYVLVDTVWDTVTLGSTTVSATTPGVGDVYLATLDASGGLLQTKMVVAAGEDQANDAVGAGDGSGDVILSGHSASSIDLGTGPLSTNTIEGEVWIARLTL